MGDISSKTIEIMAQLIIIGTSIIMMIVVEVIQSNESKKRNKNLRDFRYHGGSLTSKSQKTSKSGFEF